MKLYFRLDVKLTEVKQFTPWVWGLYQRKRCPLLTARSAGRAKMTAMPSYPPYRYAPEGAVAAQSLHALPRGRHQPTIGRPAGGGPGHHCLCGPGPGGRYAPRMEPLPLRARGRGGRQAIIGPQHFVQAKRMRHLPTPRLHPQATRIEYADLGIYGRLASLKAGGHRPFPSGRYCTRRRRPGRGPEDTADHREPEEREPAAEQSKRTGRRDRRWWRGPDSDDLYMAVVLRPPKKSCPTVQSLSRPQEH